MTALRFLVVGANGDHCDRHRCPLAAFAGYAGAIRDHHFGHPPPLRSDTLRARFTLCDAPIRVNCVVDGDTFWFRGDKIRIADIGAPEIFTPHCRDERQAGEIARDRLLVLLNAGSFTLVPGITAE